MPERRSRIFIIASLELTLTELQEVVAIVKRWVVEEDESRIPLRSFLFKEGAPELDQWFDKLLETKAERAARTKESEKKKKDKDDDAEDPKWVTQRMVPWDGQDRFAQDAAQTVWKQKWDVGATRWLDVLTDREKDNSITTSTKATEHLNAVKDLSQGEKRDGNTYIAGVPCLTPNAIAYLVHPSLNRLMTPPEKMAVQGIFVPTYISAQFDMELLDDLTGNSFSSFCFAGVQLAFTVVQGRRHKRLLQESQAASAKDMDNLLAEG